MKPSGAATALFKELQRQGVTVRVKDGEFQTRPKPDLLPPALCTAVRKYSRELAFIVTSQPSTDGGTFDNIISSSSNPEPFKVNNVNLEAEDAFAEFELRLSLYPTDPAELLAFLRGCGVEITISEKPGMIHWLRPERAIPEAELLALLTRHKPALLAVLRAEEAAKRPNPRDNAAASVYASPGLNTPPSGAASPEDQEVYRPDRDRTGMYAVEWMDDVPIVKVEGSDADARESLRYIQRHNRKIEQAAQAKAGGKRGKPENVLIAEPGQMEMEGMG